MARSKTIDFIVIFKTQGKNYSKYRITFEVHTKQLYLLDFDIPFANTFIMELGETIFMNLDINETVNLKMLASSENN